MKLSLSPRSMDERDIKSTEKTESITEKDSLLLNKLSELYTVFDKHSVISLTDLQGNIIYANDKFCEVSGYSRDELIGRNHNILKSNFHPVSFFREMWTTILSGKIWQGEIKNKTKNGNYYWVDTTISPRLNEEGNIAGYISVRNVITKSKEETERLQNALKHEKELNEMKNKFVSIVSHELKSPLTAIHTSAEILEIKSGDIGRENFTKNCSSHLSNIKEQVSRLTELIDDILSLSKVESGRVNYNPERISLKDYMQELLSDEEIRNLDERKVKARYAGNESDIFADKDLLEHIFVNVFSNAFKYSIGKPAPVLSINFGKKFAEVKIKDFGIGIPEDEQKNLFEPFYRASNSKDFRGTGIGLALVKEFLELHNAQYKIKSKSGRGTEFMIKFNYAG